MHSRLKPPSSSPIRNFTRTCASFENGGMSIKNYWKTRFQPAHRADDCRDDRPGGARRSPGYTGTTNAILGIAHPRRHQASTSSVMPCERAWVCAMQWAVGGQLDHAPSWKHVFATFDTTPRSLTRAEIGSGDRSGRGAPLIVFVCPSFTRFTSSPTNAPPTSFANSPAVTRRLVTTVSAPVYSRSSSNGHLAWTIVWVKKKSSSSTAKRRSCSRAGSRKSVVGP